MPDLLRTPLLEGEYEELPKEDAPNDLAELREQVEFLTTQCASLSQQVAQIKRALAAAGGNAPLASVAEAGSKWDLIKQRLAPRLAQAVDVLRAQGPMTNTQLAYALKMNRTNCSNNVSGQLIRQGLVVRNGNELSLKSL